MIISYQNVNENSLQNSMKIILKAILLFFKRATENSSKLKTFFIWIIAQWSKNSMKWFHRKIFPYFTSRNFISKTFLIQTFILQ